MGKDGNIDNSTKTSYINNSTKIKIITRNEFNTLLHPYKSNIKGFINNNNASSNENIISTKT